MDKAGQEIVDHIVAPISTWGLSVMGALAVFFIGRIAAGWLRKVSARQLERVKVDASLVGFLASLVY